MVTNSFRSYGMSEFHSSSSLQNSISSWSFAKSVRFGNVFILLFSYIKSQLQKPYTTYQIKKKKEQHHLGKVEKGKL